MPTTCVVVNCFNRHYKGSTIKFYRFPVDSDRRRQWVAFVSRRNEDGSTWQPRDGDRICSDHFILKQKSDLPSNPDYVPSILSRRGTESSGEEVEEALDHTGDQKRLKRFERAQQRRKKATEWERLQRIEQERDAAYHKRAQKAFVHDHGCYCKPIEAKPISTCIESLCSPDRLNFARAIDKELTIPVEVGKFVS